MNRRSFIKGSVPAALAAWTVTCKYEEPKKSETPDPTKGESSGKHWDYRVYCYEREQGEWLFGENVRGSFAPEREYMTFEDEKTWPYDGWMDHGKLHFTSLEEAQDFVDAHARTKDDINLVDSIYDVYYVDRYCERVEAADTVKDVYQEKEIKVAHYWFNGDTGRQIQWVSKDHTDWSGVENA